jgi:SAM-dependent methyltransferase
MNNKEWSERILNKVDKSFNHRWEIYNRLLIESLTAETIWVDCGCGNNEVVEALGEKVKTAVGIDILNNKNKNNFIRAEVGKLPIRSEIADLITLRFVVEHFKNVEENMSELTRILKKNGKIIILTTNLLSPLIFFPRMILPHSLKSKILAKTFKVNDTDLFPTYHKLNTPYFYNRNRFGLYSKLIVYISDLNYTRRWVFILLLTWHYLTNIKFLRKFRSNILVVLEKA